MGMLYYTKEAAQRAANEEFRKTLEAQAPAPAPVDAIDIAALSDEVVDKFNELLADRRAAMSLPSAFTPPVSVVPGVAEVVQRRVNAGTTVYLNGVPITLSNDTVAEATEVQWHAIDQLK